MAVAARSIAALRDGIAGPTAGVASPTGKSAAEWKAGRAQPAGYFLAIEMLTEAPAADAPMLLPLLPERLPPLNLPSRRCGDHRFAALVPDQAAISADAPRR